MKYKAIISFLFFILGYNTFSQTESAFECNKKDSVRFYYFETKKLDPSLKPVTLERGKMIIEFLGNFNDSIIVILDQKKVFEGFVKNTNTLLPTYIGFVVNNINRKRKLRLRIGLFYEKKCVEVCFKPKYKNLAISRYGSFWLIGNSDYTQK